MSNVPETKYHFNISKERLAQLQKQFEDFRKTNKVIKDFKLDYKLDINSEVFQKALESAYKQFRFDYINRFINHSLIDSDTTDIVLDASIKEEGLPIVSLSNLNITAQKGCFVYHNKDIQPFEEELYCVDIHKSLVPFVKKNYLTVNAQNDIKDTISTHTIYPDAEDVVEEALNDALSQLG